MTSNNIFLVIFFAAAGLLIVGAVLRKAHVWRRMIQGIAAQYMREGRTAWAENALLAGLQFGLITLEERNRMAADLDITLVPNTLEAVPAEYRRKQLSNSELKVILKKVAMIRRLSRDDQVKILITLLIENYKLTAEVNDHRSERGFHLLEVHE
jgi:hypothetical protein